MADRLLNAEVVVSPREISWAVEMALIIVGSFVEVKNDFIDSVLFKLVPTFY